MPSVELLHDVAEGGRNLEEACKAADAFGLGKSDPKYPRLKVTYTPKGMLAFKKGVVITMTADGAAKYVARGIGKVVDAVPTAPVKAAAKAEG